MNRKEITTGRESEVRPLHLARINDILNRMNEIHDKITRRAFEIFEGAGCQFGHDAENWQKAEMELLQPVRMDIAETDNQLKVMAEVPGFTEKELEVAIEPRRLTITGQHEAAEEKKEGKLLWKERCAEHLLRVVDLPAEVEAEKAKATLKNGILEIEMPKVTVARKIQIQAKAAAA
jgi:HSP20 family protein